MELRQSGRLCTLLLLTRRTHPAREGSSSLNIWKEMPSTSCRMGSGGRKVFWALCFVLLLLKLSSAKDIWKRALHARLAEKPHVSAGWGGWEEMGDPQTLYVHSASTPSKAGSAGVFLSLNVSKSGGVGRWNSYPQKALFLEAKSSPNTCEGTVTCFCLSKYAFS